MIFAVSGAGCDAVISFPQYRMCGWFGLVGIISYLYVCVGCVVDFTGYSDNSGWGSQVAELHVSVCENAL